MNETLSKKSAVKEATKEFHEHISKAFSKEHKQVVNWKFPKPNTGDDRLPTWFINISGGNPKKYLVIGFTPEFRWKAKKKRKLTRCPILLAFSDEIISGKSDRAMTPIVEVNIPIPPRRGVNGCFAPDKKGMWLLHRGTRMTVNGNQKLSREDVHKYFKKNYKYHLRELRDLNGINKTFIPIVRITTPKERLLKRLICFVETVKKLKEAHG